MQSTQDLWSSDATIIPARSSGRGLDFGSSNHIVTSSRKGIAAVVFLYFLVRPYKLHKYACLVESSSDLPPGLVVKIGSSMLL
mmetsp:Transcript_23234/g.53925  ORF Transcript_23234/g.53925 Transcript_23234/m.53925 type:complete len:83 (-) Transcript_23234:739-987(-)